MLELQVRGTVTVRHIPVDINPADSFTKVTARVVSDKHRSTLLNVSALRTMVSGDTSKIPSLARGQAKDVANECAGRRT